LALLLLLLAPGPLTADEFTAKGTVLDADGKPVAGIEVANFWGFDKGQPSPFNAVKTGPDGSFSVKLNTWQPKAVLLACDAKAKRAALIEFTKGDAARPLTLKLAPAVRVHGEFVSKDLGRNPGWTNVYVTTPSDVRLLQCMSTTSKFDFLLPPGKYKFNGYGGDIKNHRRTLELATDDLDLKQIDVPGTVIAMHVGKAPPAWNVTDARGLSKRVTLDDFKGKWVAVEFWGFW
jgi:hypothetical protein